MENAPSILVVLNRRHARAWRRRGAWEGAVVETASASEGRRRAEEAAAGGARIVVAAGGDGTVRSVAHGLLCAGASAEERPALAIAPLGHGNDLARALGIGPADARAWHDGVDARLDAGCVRLDGAESFFVNSLGLGLEARVAGARRRLPKGWGYTVAALRHVLFGRRESWAFQGRRDGAPFAFRGAVLSIGNGCSTGGGYRLTPDARTDDGLLDYCAVPTSARLPLLAALRRARRGRHAGRAEIGRVRRLVLRADPGVPVHADGDLLAGAAREVEVGVLAGALRVRLPRGTAYGYAPGDGTA